VDGSSRGLVWGTIPAAVCSFR